MWLDDKKLYVKESTYSAYLLLVKNHLIPTFGEVSKIEEENAQAFVFEKLEAGLNQKTVKDIIIVLKMILKFAYAKGLWDYKELVLKFPSEKENKELEVLSVNNQRKLMSFLEANFTFKNLGIYICLSTGIRIGELCALQWKDIDLIKGTISISKTLQRIYIIDDDDKHTELLIDSPKTKNSMREIPMVYELINIVRPLKKIVNEECYVLTNELKPTEPRTYRNYYKRILKKLDIPDLKFHGLRHSFATRCIESNCDYKTVSVILGHSNITTTLNLYVHPNLDQKKKCIQKMRKSLK